MNADAPQGSAPVMAALAGGANMARRSRPPSTKRSEHWLRVMVNDYPTYLNDCISKAFGWDTTGIEWRSPLRDDDYAEYYDQEFLKDSV